MAISEGLLDELLKGGTRHEDLPGDAGLMKERKCPTQNSSLAIRRVIRLIDEMNIHASADATEASQSFARRRQRLSQAKVARRSTVWAKLQSPICGRLRLASVF